MERLRIIRSLALVFLMGTATGAYGLWNYDHGQADRIMSVALRGYCAQKDVTGQPYWYSCQDAAIAAELTQRDIARDQETAAILSQLEANAPPAKQARRVKP